MTTILTTTLYYISYPFVLLFSLLLTIAAPLVHLVHYVVYGLCLWPFEVLAKFETLYIFFGVATLVGVLAGTGLYFISSFLFAALSLENTQLSSSSSSEHQQQQKQQRRLRTLADVREGRRRRDGWDEMGSEIPRRRSGKGIKEEIDRDDERAWLEMVKGAYRRAEGFQEERAATTAAGGGKGKINDGYGDWSGRREKERDGEMGRKGVMTSTILEEESRSEMGF